MDPEKTSDFSVYVRVPAWSRSVNLKVNGATVTNPAMDRGFARLSRTWKEGDTVEVSFPMPVERVRAHPSIEQNAGRVALMRGPVVYALESADNPEPVQELALSRNTKFTVDFVPDLLGGVAVIRGTATYQPSAWASALYLPFDRLPVPKQTNFTAIPYYANANRGPVDMTVWIPEE